jgi:hypothetical protein
VPGMDGRRRRSTGLRQSRAQSGRRLGLDGFRGRARVRAGAVRAWVGLRPAKQRRPAKEMKGHGRTLVAGPRKEDGLRVEGVGLRHAQELKGRRRTSAVGLGPIETKVYLFSEFNFQCENNSRKT